MNERLVGRSEYEVITKNADGEAERHQLESRRYVPEYTTVNLAELAPTATPVVIRPSRRKAPERDYQQLFVFGDAQIAYREIDGEYVPTHDERAMRVGRFICRDLCPDIIVNLSDHVDFPTLSKYAPSSDHFMRTTQRSIDRGHEYWAELKADTPTAELHEVDSNHTVRLARLIGGKAIELYGLRQAGTSPDSWHAFSYPNLMNFDKLGVNFHSGYGAARYTYKDDMVFMHGNKVRSNGSTAEMLSKQNPYFNLVVGHGHKFQWHTRTTPDGKYYSVVQNGPLCKITGEVEGYNSAIDDKGRVVPTMEDWQQSVLSIRDYGESNYEITPIFINNGRAFFNGKLYEAGQDEGVMYARPQQEAA